MSNIIKALEEQMKKDYLTLHLVIVVQIRLKKVTWRLQAFERVIGM